MTAMMVSIRPTTKDDVPALCSLLNKIIAVGGTTAYQKPLDIKDFEVHFLEADDFLNCLSAVDDDDNPIGFQSLRRHPKLEKNWADIATFAQLEPKISGVGSALFDATRKWAKSQNITAINATIRADNVPGLAYYEKMGFRTYSIASNVALDDGNLVDRISKSLFL